MEKMPVKGSLVAVAIGASLIIQCLMVPTTARASILGGCAGTYDTGVPGAVGWVDGGVMLGLEAARPPSSFKVVGPDGTRTTYTDGAGLIPPTDSMPLWFAPVDQLGDYTVTIDDEVCIVTVTDLAAAPTHDDEVEISSWTAHSAPTK
jgi:hypothetical protein